MKVEPASGKRRLKRNDAGKSSGSEVEEEEELVRRPTGGPSGKKRAMINDSDEEDDIVSKASSKENKNLFNAVSAAPTTIVPKTEATTSLPPGKGRRKVKKSRYLSCL